MDRRGFLSGLAVAGTGAAAVALGVETGQIRVSPPYVPAGRIEAGSHGSRRVDYITLDGKRLEHVMECDDVEGWVRLYVDMDHDDGPKIERRSGEVRVHWRKA